MNDDSTVETQRRNSLAKSVLSAALGAWALALGVGASHLLAGVLFPARALEAIELQPGDLRDSVASPVLRTSLRTPSASPAASTQDATLGVTAQAPARTVAGSPSIEPAVANRPLDENRPARAASEFSGGLMASAGPALWGTVAQAPPPVALGRATAASLPGARQAADRMDIPQGRNLAARETAGGKQGARAQDPARSGETQPSAASAAGRTSNGDAGAVLNAFPAGSRAAAFFQPAAVQASGGRVGQGSISMEQAQGATFRDFDPKAKGFGEVTGKTPPGPSLPAGGAPAIPSRHVPIIIAAAARAGVDPALLAATAARESHFGEEAYRAEPQLKQVSWSKTPNSPEERFFDGSIGPTQVLRSNFLARGIDNDRDAFDLENNYRVSADIIRGNLNAFPGNDWKGVAAYNVGQYGARIGRVPTGNYVDTILAWRKAYAAALRPYR